MDPVEKIAAAVLYEGYLLWPYRRSARKNRQRWPLGGVYPRAYSESGAAGDPWQMQTQCLVAGRSPVVRARVRFLQVVERKVARRGAGGAREWVDALEVGDERYLAWDEATERELRLEPLPLAEPAGAGRRLEISVPAGSAEEPLGAAGPEAEGALVRRWESLRGAVEAHAESLREGLFRLTLRVVNLGDGREAERERALRRAFLSTHAILTVEGGEFLSLTDPPAEAAAAASACENRGTWPVLAGEEGDRSTLLSSPIILYDYPQIAPESPGDLFDGTEIDQLLVLNLLALTDAEKAEIRATDPRGREILERTEALGPDDFMRLHGALRDFRVLRPEAAGNPTGEWDPLAALERPVPESVTVAGVPLRPGSRVRLRPRPGRDSMDLLLAGKTAVVESIEQDYEDRLHLAVTVEDDHGRDLGAARVLGHRFFFAPEELEPLPEAAPETAREGAGEARL